MCKIFRMRKLKYKHQDTWHYINLNGSENLRIAFEKWENIGKTTIFYFFTGLQDKFKNDIYEGDILQIGENLVGSVYFSKGMEEHQYEKYGGCFLINTQHSSFPFDEYAFENCKIIGNVIDNPKLLNGN